MKAVNIVLSIFICIVLGLTACQKSKPIVFNETIVEVNDIVTNAMFRFDTQTENMADLDNYSQINSKADSILDILNNQLKTIKALETPSHGEIYKDAAIKFIESTKASIEYKKKYTETPKNKIDSVRNEYAKLFNELPVCSEKLKEAQKSFAKLNELELK